MTPYELLYELKEHKILFNYFETSTIEVDSTGWKIKGKSDDGILTVIKTSAPDVFRFTVPLPIDLNIPFTALEKILLSVQSELEGILTVESNPEGFVLQYVFHTTLDSLNPALINFVNERSKVKSTFKEAHKIIQKTKKDIAEDLKKQIENGFNNPKQRKDASEDLKENTSVWDQVNAIDKQPHDEYDDLEDDLYFDDLDEYEDEDLTDYDEDEIDLNPPRPFDEEDEEDDDDFDFNEWA